MSNGTSNRPDLSDPMGPPKFITGPEYIDALGRVGFNINDPAGLSKMFEIAQQGTNLLDTVYKQNMAVQAAQAELGLKVAQTGYYDSETDYNKASMGARIKDLETQATYRDAATKNLTSEANIRDQTAQINLAEGAKVRASRDAALDELNPMMTELDDLAKNHLNDPDFETQVNGIVNNHKAVMMDQTGTAMRMAQQKIEAIRAMRTGSSMAGVYANQRSQIDDLLRTNDISQDPNYSARIARGEGPAIVAQGYTNRAINRLQTVQARARDMNRPDLVDQAAGEIRQLQIAQNPQRAAMGGEQIQGMVVPPMTKPDGSLNENTEGLIQGMETATGLRAQPAAAGPAAKPPKTTVTFERDPQDPNKIILKSYQQVTEGETPGATTGAPAAGTTGVTARPEDVARQRDAILNDPVYKQVLDYVRSGQVPVRGSLGSNDPAQVQAAQNDIMAYYRQAKAAQGQPVPGETPAQTQQGAGAGTQAGAAQQPQVPFVTPQAEAGGAALTREQAEAEADRRLGPERAGFAADAARKAAEGQKVQRVEDQAMQERERIIQGLVAPKPAARQPSRPAARGGGAAAAPASSAGMSDEDMQRFVNNPQVTGDPIWNQIGADVDSGDNPLPGNVSPYTLEGRRALIDRYLQEKAGQTGQAAPTAQAQTQVAEAALPPRAAARPDQVVSQQIANQTQVQNAAAPVLVVNDPARVDYHTFKFGNATTFGLNYDGTRDWEDDGVGFYSNPVTGRPYNTRDPTLVGASVPTADLVAQFGPEAARPSSALSRMISRGDIQVQIAQPNGGVVQMPLVDQGPGAKENATLDLTHAASRLFLTQGKRVLGFRFVDRYGNPFTRT